MLEQRVIVIALKLVRTKGALYESGFNCTPKLEINLSILLRKIASLGGLFYHTLYLMILTSDLRYEGNDFCCI